MKTRILILTIFSLLSSIFVKAQDEEQNILAKLIITNAICDGKDYSQLYLKNESYTIFYTSNNDGLVYMANVITVAESQSFGPIYDIEYRTIEEPNNNYKINYMSFKWDYRNTYDKKKGTAKVDLTKTYTQNEITFKLKITPEDGEIILFTGYMANTIDFKQTNKKEPNSF